MTNDTDTKSPREGSKSATLVDMLRRNTGAILEEMT